MEERNPEIKERRAKQSPSYWQGLVEEYKESGVRMDEFCAERGIVVGTFKNWVYKRRFRAQLVASGKNKFVEVKVPQVAAQYRLVLSRNREVILSGGFEMSRVKELVELLEQRDV